eukprot:5914196-Heterocapsa_arctica.AAC.1
MHHMLGKEQHQRLQERHVRDTQQPYTGAMEHDEGKATVHELDHPGEDRQDVRHPNGTERAGAQGAEHIGS